MFAPILAKSLIVGHAVIVMPVVGCRDCGHIGWCCLHTVEKSAFEGQLSEDELLMSLVAGLNGFKLFAGECQLAKLKSVNF